MFYYSLKHAFMFFFICKLMLLTSIREIKSLPTFRRQSILIHRSILPRISFVHAPWFFQRPGAIQAIYLLAYFLITYLLYGRRQASVAVKSAVKPCQWLNEITCGMWHVHYGFSGRKVLEVRTLTDEERIQQLENELEVTILFGEEADRKYEDVCISCYGAYI